MSTGLTEIQLTCIWEERQRSKNAPKICKIVPKCAYCLYSNGHYFSGYHIEPPFSLPVSTGVLLFLFYNSNQLLLFHSLFTGIIKTLIYSFLFILNIS